MYLCGCIFACVSLLTIRLALFIYSTWMQVKFRTYTHSIESHCYYNGISCGFDEQYCVNHFRSTHSPKVKDTRVKRVRLNKQQIYVCKRAGSRKTPKHINLKMILNFNDDYVRTYSSDATKYIWTYIYTYSDCH